MTSKKVDIESQENFSTGQYQPVRIKTLEFEKAGEKWILTGHSQKRKKSRYAAARLEFDAEGLKALTEVLDLTVPGEVMKADEKSLSKSLKLSDSRIFKDEAETPSIYEIRYRRTSASGEWRSAVEVWSNSSKQWYELSDTDIITLAIKAGIDNVPTGNNSGTENA